MGNWQHTAGLSPPRAEGSFSYREAGREKKKKKWGDIFCSHCPLRAYYFLIIAIFIEDIPRGSFCRGETTALGVTLGWTSKPYLGREPIPLSATEIRCGPHWLVCGFI